MYADEAAPYRKMLEISYPIDEGLIKNWEDFEKLWSYTFHTKMGKSKDLSDTCILVTEAAKCPAENRKRMADILFNNFGFKAILFETQALLSLMAEGHHTGCVLDSGDGVTHVIPVV